MTIGVLCFNQVLSCKDGLCLGERNMETPEPFDIHDDEKTDPDSEFFYEKEKVRLLDEYETG